MVGARDQTVFPSFFFTRIREAQEVAVFSAFPRKGDGREGRWRESGRQTSSPGSIENADVEL